MRKPAVPNVKVKIAPKIDWPTKGGYHSGIPMTNLSGSKVLTVWIQDGESNYSSRVAAALRLARHLTYIHNQAVEQKQRQNRVMKAITLKLKQQGNQP